MVKDRSNTLRFLAWLVVGLVTVVACPRMVEAHALKVFASRVGNRIEGYAYFPGGGRAAGMKVILKKTDGPSVAHARTDENGKFAFSEVKRTQSYRIVAESTGGHVAIFEIPSERSHAEETTEGRKTGEEHPANRDGTPELSDRSIQRTVERAVARKIRPLREQIDRMQSRARFQDILGGIGYILGICGIAFYWMARREKDGGGDGDGL